MSSPMQGSLAPWMQGAAAVSEGTERDRAARQGGAVAIVERRALEAVERGDFRAALTLLMDAYGEDIYKFCRQLTGDAELAEDLRQVVFIQAFEQLASFEPRSTLRAWLYGIARHRCLDACKSKRRWFKRVQSMDAAAENVASEPQDLAGALDQTVIEHALTHCLGKLDINLRMLILMRYRDGLSYTELAVAFRAKPATLQARVARIIPRLRRCVQGKGVIP